MSRFLLFLVSDIRTDLDLNDCHPILERVSSGPLSFVKKLHPELRKDNNDVGPNYFCRLFVQVLASSKGSPENPSAIASLPISRVFKYHCLGLSCPTRLASSQISVLPPFFFFPSQPSSFHFYFTRSPCSSVRPSPQIPYNTPSLSPSTFYNHR